MLVQLNLMTGHFWVSHQQGMGKGESFPLMALVAWETWGDTGSTGFLVKKSPKNTSFYGLLPSHLLFLFFSFSSICILFLPARDSFLLWVVQLLG